MLLKFEYDLNRATASYQGRPFYDCIQYKYEIGSAAGAFHGTQIQNDIEISVSYAKPLLFSISASTEQHAAWVFACSRHIHQWAKTAAGLHPVCEVARWGVCTQRKIWAQHLQATPPSIQMHWLHEGHQRLQREKKCICICSSVSEGNTQLIADRTKEAKAKVHCHGEKQRRWRLGSNPVISELGHLLAKKKSI